MKKTLTITVDAEVLSVAKQYARSRNLSLSELIERELTEVVAGKTPSFASRWRGRFKATRRANPRHDRLAGKYL